MTNIFSNIKIWDEFKYKTLFKSQKDLDNFKRDNLNIEKPKNIEQFLLTTSGTTFNIPQQYLFPKSLFHTINNHHMWKIFQSHGIPYGNAIKIFQTNSTATNYLDGPFKQSDMGLKNKSWNLFYNPKKVNLSFWRSIFEQIQYFKPVFIYTSPSCFVAMQDILDSVLGDSSLTCPIIFSCETLTDITRKDALVFFPKAIDKMKDWSNSFGFFECKNGTKHVYDEFCEIEQSKNHRIWCRSYFNFFDSSKKLSDDLVELNVGLCECGIYGNQIIKFEGKTFECLISKNGIKYSANFISNYLLSLSKLEIFLRNYQIIQDKEKNISINISQIITDRNAFILGSSLSKILLDNQSIAKILHNNTVIYESDSDMTIHIENKDFVLNRHKKLSVRSYAIN